MKKVLSRVSEAPTPTWLKFVVIVQAFLFFVVSGLSAPLSIDSILPAAIFAASVAVLVALWRLRAWTLYGLPGIVGFYIVTHIGLGLVFVAWRGFLLGIVVRSIALAAAFTIRKSLR
jgi:hypothetical protein